MRTVLGLGASEEGVIASTLPLIPVKLYIWITGLGKLRIITWGHDKQNYEGFPDFTELEELKCNVTLEENINRETNNLKKNHKIEKPEAPQK